MHLRFRLQIAEALGQVNRYYCSLAHGCEIRDPETLMNHFIRQGGAADFALRYDEAMGPLNRWYCSEFYRREITDPEILWDYYVNYSVANARRSDSSRSARLSMAS